MLKKKIISFLMAGIFVLSSGYNLVYASTFEENEYKQELVNENEFTIINSNENEMIVDKKGNNTYVSTKVTPGSWKNVKYLGQKSRKLSSPYTRERIIQTIQWGLDYLSGGSSFLLGLAESIYREKVYDITKYGGVYTKTYYRRQITDIRNSHANVPVPYRYEYVTYFYSSSNFKKVVYTERVGDGIKLANN
ncbi:TPA: hypothetical protein ACMVR8_003593 [Clostridioides difficile]|uniref:hypothetical protein n=1 Tax=Clostridioides difficile TaxID=1496 RepID=UPI0008A12B56|nr:hypothetical protein [Clostridioides difficile]OFU03352.1 hypothetical protein HMPREF3083_12900 [Clostridium sp. HMSC19D07]EGT4533178.1 hypothetical protein [Clostridioides difficile]EGT4710565.1 hypothetical protein [Clostridioides difficile]EGT4837909.1 hypothetical protein [Clostridioides difficile]EGT4913840.1 hypothetical protein [Clostridioides difficile]